MNHSSCRARAGGPAGSRAARCPCTCRAAPHSGRWAVAAPRGTRPQGAASPAPPAAQQRPHGARENARVPASRRHGARALITHVTVLADPSPARSRQVTDEQHSLEGALKLLKGSKTKAESAQREFFLCSRSADALALARSVDGDSAPRFAGSRRSSPRRTTRWCRFPDPPKRFGPKAHQAGGVASSRKRSAPFA